MKAYSKIIFAMLLWGSLAIFVKPVSYTSAEIVSCRIVLGALFLLGVFFCKGRKSDGAAFRRNGLRLLLSGIFMGLNWVALFEAYRYVDVSVATLAYYCAPVIVMICAVPLFHERLGFAKMLCMLSAVVGMVVVTGVQMGGSDPVRGVFLGLLSAVLYASVTLINKTVRGMQGLEITLVQLAGAAASVIPYALLRHAGPWAAPTATELVCLLVLGFVHTGIALSLYFSAIQELPAQSVAMCSYLDPVSALVFAAIFLSDRLTFVQLVGAVLILGGALAGELLGKKGAVQKRAASDAAVPDKE